MAIKNVWVGAAVTVALAALALAVGTAQAATIHVEMKSSAFDAKDITIEVGDTVVWTNNDSKLHDVTFEAGFDSGGPGSMEADDTFSHTFDDAGEFLYNCTIHSTSLTAGMVGSVTVETPLPASDHYVEMINSQFRPAELHIEPGESVTWINNETFAHDVLFEAGFGSGGPASIEVGGTYTYTFTENGTYVYRCEIHSGNYESGMVGIITVGTVEPPPEPSTPGFEASLVAMALFGALLLAGTTARRRR